MVSVNYTASNSAALASLRTMSTQIAQSQTRLATGYKVNSAADDATAWVAATKLRSESKRQTSLDAGIVKMQGKAEGTAKALDKIVEIMEKMKTIALSSSNGSVDLVSLEGQMDAYQNQIKNIITGATINGENWLNTASASKTVTVNFDSSGAAITSDFTTTLGYLSTATDASRGIFEPIVEDMAALTGSNATTVSGVLDTAISNAAKYSAELTAYSDGLTAQQEIRSTFESIRQKAISSLVDADIEEETARLQALQVKQQLAYQALAITNSSAQNILLLFR